jgi:hypothetical protein
MRAVHPTAPQYKAPQSPLVRGPRHRSYLTTKASSLDLAQGFAAVLESVGVPTLSVHTLQRS